MRSTVALLVLVAACGGSSQPAPTGPSPTVPAPAAPPPTLADPALQPLAFMAGSWRTADGTIEIWTPAGDALFGVGFSNGGFEAAILAADEGKITFRAMPGGQPAVPFVLDTATLADGDARFTNPAHDDPQVLHYVRKGDALEATVSKLDGTNALTFRYERFTHTPAPALSDADRTFAADTARDGSAGWTKWFAPDGAMLRPTGRVEGHAASKEMMSPLLDDPAKELVWEPIADGFPPAGDLGFSVGEAYILNAGKKVWFGAYVTIWKKQPDGTWRVLFDTGDDDSRRSGDA
jgi:ketosteroid isomerase-like protein